MIDRLDGEYDYVVVGGGSAGCVVANRLSADPGTRVLLLEAGVSDRSFPANLKSHVPAFNLFLLPHAKYNWNYHFAAQESTGGRTIPCPRGKILGGCSSINASVYIRGHPLDYDEWASHGNPGWGWRDVLPAFKRHENFHGAPSAWHGQSGEVEVSTETTNPLVQAFVDAAVAAGHARNDDPNGVAQEGIGPTSVTQHGGVRSSASRAFLHPILARTNLTVATGALVERLTHSGDRVTGVVVSHGPARREIRAARDVVLCAGTINSPQLLMLSGIGPAGHLRSLGIEVVHDLPGVGQNLQDHPTVQVSVLDRSGRSYAFRPRRALQIAMAPLVYLMTRKGMLGSNAAEAGGFLRTLPELDRPDVQLTLAVGLRERAHTLPRRHGIMILAHLMRPRSRGYLALRSARPDEAPLLHSNFLADPADVDTLVRGVREVRRIAAAEPLASMLGPEVQPGAQRQSDDELRRFVRATFFTGYHPVGTCKMGPATDPLAVVDAELRLHGMSGLRIADASIMPDIIGGNTNAPAMMIGERAAGFILHHPTARLT